MNSRILNHITGRLSLRPPQTESLLRLGRALEAAPEMLGHERDVQAVLAGLKGASAEDEAHNVLDRDRRLIVREIHAQMLAHFWEKATAYQIQVSRRFTELKPCNYTISAGHTTHHFRETVTEASRVKQMLFSGFERCLYPLQKFDSDTERRFAVILERDASKWFKLAKGQFQIYYKLGLEVSAIASR